MTPSSAELLADAIDATTAAGTVKVSVRLRLGGSVLAAPRIGA